MRFYLGRNQPSPQPSGIFSVRVFAMCAALFIITAAAEVFADNRFVTTDIPNIVNEKPGRMVTITYTYNPSAVLRESMANFAFISIVTDTKVYDKTIVLQPGKRSLHMYPFMFESPVRSISIEAAPELIDVFGSTKQALQPWVVIRAIDDVRSLSGGGIPASFEDIVYWKGSEYTRFGVGNSNDGDVFRWERYPAAAVFLFLSADIQAKYLKRLAFFVEKKGTRGSILSNERITNLHGWGAHDYKADDLARFFETARAQNVRLNPEEYELKSILVRLGILHYAPDSSASNNADMRAVAEGSGAIATVSRSYSTALEKVLLTHELMHTWFFRDKNLRARVHSIWNGTSSALKKNWKNFLARLRYDDEFEYLVENEFFAYLLQRPLHALETYAPIWFAYGTPDQEKAELTREVRTAAAELQRYINRVYDAQAGFVRYVFE